MPAPGRYEYKQTEFYQMLSAEDKAAHDAAVAEQYAREDRRANIVTVQSDRRGKYLLDRDGVAVQTEESARYGIRIQKRYTDRAKAQRHADIINGIDAREKGQS